MFLWEVVNKGLNVLLNLEQVNFFSLLFLGWGGDEPFDDAPTGQSRGIKFKMKDL